MNLKQIKSLAEILEASGLSVLEISQGEEKIRMEKIRYSRPAACEPGPGVQIRPGSESAASENGVPSDKEVKSPMVGVYYAAPAPDAEPYVTVGSRVQKGDILCIIEAMKLMNEICAETDGQVVEICTENGQVVEFGQTLIKLK